MAWALSTTQRQGLSPLGSPWWHSLGNMLCRHELVCASVIQNLHHDDGSLFCQVSNERKIWLVRLPSFAHFTICELESIKKIVFEHWGIEQTSEICVSFLFLIYSWGWRIEDESYVSATEKKPLPLTVWVWNIFLPLGDIIILDYKNSQINVFLS